MGINSKDVKLAKLVNKLITKILRKCNTNYKHFFFKVIKEHSLR